MTHSPSTLRSVAVWLSFLAVAVSSWAQLNYATPYYFSTLASTPSIGSINGIGSGARFFKPQGIAVDISGNLYVADSDNNTIRKISPAGLVTTLAGTAGQPGSADGAGNLARFNFPSSIVVDALGVLYVADANNHTIRKISTTGVVTTIAGAAGVADSTDGSGGTARFNRPEGLAIDAAGNLYVADAGNNLIRKISPTGLVTTLAGSAGVSGSTNGTGSAASFSAPFRIAVDTTGTLYVSEAGNYDVRKITPGGVVTTLFPGRFLYGYSGTPASFPASIAVTVAGKVFFADRYDNSIAEISPTGVITTFAGSGTTGYIDGASTIARFNGPTGLVADASGTLYVADTDNNTIRKITPTGDVTTLAGLADNLGSADGAGIAARFNGPSGVAVDNSGNAYIADIYNNTIRKISPTGVVTTLAGMAGSTGSLDGTGSAARFNWPSGVAVDSTANVYVADSSNHAIRKITPARVVTTLAGSADPAISGSTDGTGTAARFSHPSALTVDSSGNIIVIDQWNNTIRKVTPGGVVTTLAGTPGQIGSADGAGAAVSFYVPTDVAADNSGNVYVVDSGNQTIRKINGGGVVTTFAGVPGAMGATDGTGSDVRFTNPYGVAVDGSGNLFVTENNNTVRKITPAGAVTTIAGSPIQYGSDDGTGSAARFNYPRGVAVDGAGKLYLADSGNNTIRIGQPADPPVISAPPLSQTVAAGASVLFSVTAGGSPAPTYQWYFNGNIFNGATTNTLSFANARSTDAGDYTVIVTNSLGSVTSPKATLTISSAPGTPPSTPGGTGAGGGGSLEGWFTMALIMLGLVRRILFRADRS